MGLSHLSVEVLAEWVITGRGIEDLLSEIAERHGMSPEDYGNARNAVLADFEHLQGTNVNRLRGLRGNPNRLRQEIAGILRW